MDTPLVSLEEAEMLNRQRMPFVVQHYDESRWLIQERRLSGFQGDGINAHRKSSNAETNPNYNPNPDLRCASVLQGRHNRDPKIHDDIGAELVNLQGLAEKDGMEYGRSGHDKS